VSATQRALRRTPGRAATGSAERWFLLPTEAADSGGAQQMIVHGDTNDPPVLWGISLNSMTRMDKPGRR